MSTHEMPTPGPEHKNLAQLSGKWEGKEVMLPSPWAPEKQERFGRINARVLEGFFVVSEYVQEAQGKETFRGHGVYSYDPKDKQYVMYWFDSMGGAGAWPRATTRTAC